jgi:hypothetical protein
VSGDVFYPLFADGPAKGQRLPVSRWHLTSGFPVGYVKPHELPLPSELLEPPEPGHALYRFWRLEILGHTLWVGICGDEGAMLLDEDREALFEQLTAPRAREAELRESE